MRGEASRLADRSSRDLMASKIQALGSEAGKLAEQMFTLCDVLDANPRLQRAMTDPGRPVEDKKKLVRTLMGEQAMPITLEILDDLVARSWSRAYDIDNAVEDFGVDAVMYEADSRGQTLQISVELAKLQSALLNLPVVRSSLSGSNGVTAEARVELLHKLIDNAHFDKMTVKLAEHAAANPRKRRFVETLQWLISKFSRHMGESMVTVTTATPLNDEQIQRLIDVYTKKLGRKAFIHCVVDPSVLGGMRVQVGDEVTDRTVVAQLENLQRMAKVSFGE
ncbi:ATP synthase F0F1 subunit delta [Bifidobacterium dolichotidis]|uniref:ATP synthase subunit delta n=1 Tax=Bifidobacterium dolichotidis TaxID=2306976 RepID=A0A430FRK3_9BIFI|nr:F0F1 ATP synthase subunit delta [Bifidobacterium dolichotidis]RSX55487.1 ATP synthase F0F1 subunit delta [Bifidobacterium dolichotidis]